MTAARDRKEAAKRLGIALAADFRRMVEANGPEEINQAAMTLGTNFNTNIEFIIWVLKEYGGVSQMPFARPTPPVNGHGQTLPRTPALLTGQD